MSDLIEKLEPPPYAVINLDKSAVWAIKPYEKFCDFLILKDGEIAECYRYRTRAEFDRLNSKWSGINGVASD